ncbi:nad-p-binding protein [Mucor ambiguus]|uniref:Nad-p-binding protein n=1 Tax=Mucor ambiguus TaxID=91626 RepID=A0A0C9MRC9_9FUNG|nr:nad-p-binding protein [Mucor ambiguus]
MAQFENTLYRFTDKKSSYKGIQQVKETINVNDIGKNEVLLKIKAVALNYRDFAIAAGSYPVGIKDNLIPGSDATAEIIQVGSAVSDLEVGDRVITNFDPENLYGQSKNLKTALGAAVDGVLSQYKVVPSYAVNKLPKDSHLTDEEAACLVCTGVTSWNALYGTADKFIAGQTVLMLGTGGVSITSLILAKAAGAVTIITSSSDEKLKYVKEKWGVDHTINYNTNPDWEQQVLDLTHGEGVDFVIENGGSGTIMKSMAATKVGGQVASIGFLGHTKEMPDIMSLVLLRSIRLRGIAVGSKQLAEELIRFVHAKKLRMPVEQTFGFSTDQVYEAYAKIESQTHIGKLVIKVD